MKRKLWLKLGVVVFWLSWPALWLYLRRSERTRLLLKHQDSFLVVRGWMSDGKWQLPGGGLHTGERRVKGLLREVQEETGLELAAEDVKLLTAEQCHVNGLRFKCHYFAAHIKRPLKPKLQGKEIAEITWLQRSDIRPATCGADVLRALELLDERR